MSSFYTGIFILNIMALVLMCLITSSNPALSKRRKRQFISVYVIVMVGAVCEWSAIMAGQYALPVWFRTALKFSEFLITPMIPYSLLFVLPNNNKTLIGIARWVIVLNAALQVVSLFTGCVFYVDSASVYRHGPLYVLYTAAYLTGAVCIVIGMIRTVRSYQSSRAYVTIMMLVFFGVGLLMHIIDSSIRSDYITIAWVLMFFYIQYLTLIQSTDSLTKLLNRHSYDSKIGNLDEISTLVMMDIDLFKESNDNYGHLHGDKVLEVVSNTIRETFIKRGLCYRIGGDEFCVILKGSCRDIDSILSEFHRALEKCRETDNTLPFVSTGYAVYTPGEDSLVEAKEKADSMLYRFKKTRKALLARGEDADYAVVISKIAK